MDKIVLISDAERDRVFAISSWKTRDAAERYHREEVQRIEESLRYPLETGQTLGGLRSIPRQGTRSPPAKPLRTFHTAT